MPGSDKVYGERILRSLSVKSESATWTANPVYTPVNKLSFGSIDVSAAADQSIELASCISFDTTFYKVRTWLSMIDVSQYGFKAYYKKEAIWTVDPVLNDGTTREAGVALVEGARHLAPDNAVVNDAANDGRDRTEMFRVQLTGETTGSDFGDYDPTQEGESPYIGSLNYYLEKADYQIKSGFITNVDPLFSQQFSQLGAVGLYIQDGNDIEFPLGYLKVLTYDFSEDTIQDMSGEPEVITQIIRSSRQHIMTGQLSVPVMKNLGLLLGYEISYNSSLKIYQMIAIDDSVELERFAMVIRGYDGFGRMREWIINNATIRLTDTIAIQNEAAKYSFEMTLYPDSVGENYRYNLSSQPVTVMKVPIEATFIT